MMACEKETLKVTKILGLIGAIFISLGLITVVYIYLAFEEAQLLKALHENHVMPDNTQYVPCECGVVIEEQPAAIISAKIGNLISNKKAKITPLIFGGTEAPINSIPWQVGLKVRGHFPYCGGTIIGPTSILTAAHCVDGNVDPHQIKVILAEHDWSVLNETNSFEITVHDYSVHPSYSSAAILYDYAILRTDDVIPFSKTVNAACLPNYYSRALLDNENLKISGWGKIPGKDDFYDDTKKLLTATVKAYSSMDCCKFRNDFYQCETNRIVEDESVLCAGNPTEHVGVCFGDSGGPLIHFNGTHNVLVGVTSFVVGSCGTLGVVDGFARVTHQLPWIRKHGDNYVRACSARIHPDQECDTDSNCNRPYEKCFQGSCDCEPGAVRDDNGVCQDECQLMQATNECSKGVYQATGKGWQQTIGMTSGRLDISNWCFCHVSPYSRDNYFLIEYNSFITDYSGDDLFWYSSYKKMPSKLLEASSGIHTSKVTLKSYSAVMQAMWYSTALELLFKGWNVTVTAL